MGVEFPSYILLADDDADDRALFHEALKELGLSKIKYESVPGGEELMSHLHQSVILPDLLFLDLNMPKKNGLECLKEIKEDKKFKNICIIIYSTSVQFQDINATLNGGANLYFTKPTLFTELVMRLKNVLALDWTDYKAKVPLEKFVVSDGMSF